MSHPIFISWMNETSDTLQFGQPTAREGTLPSATPTSMPASGSSSVTADQVGNFQPGPVGSFLWINVSNDNETVSASYVHPAGFGQSSVTVACSANYQVSDDGATWHQANTYEDPSLEQHTATIKLYIRPTPA